MAVLGVFLALLAGSARAQSPEPVRLPARFTMGYLSERVEYSMQYMTPALSLFRKRLAPLGVTEVALEVAPSIEQMGDWVRSGKVDVFISTPYPVLRTARIAGVRPVLHGIPLRPKQSTFYVRQDSPVQTLADLDGKKLAFTFTYSSPGYFVPILHLLKRGFVLDRPVPGKRVVYSNLSGHNVNSLYWVFFGKCDAAAVGDDDVKKVSPKLQKALRKLEDTATFPGFFVLMSPARTAEQQRVLVELLATMHADPAGQELLSKTYSCQRMVPIDREVGAWIAEADAAITALGAAPGH